MTIPAQQPSPTDFKIEQTLDAVPNISEGVNATDDFKMLPLYRVIVEHQLSAQWWENRDSLESLRQRASVLIKGLELRIKDSVFLPVPLVRVESMNIKTIGNYSPKPDGYAITGTVRFNSARLGDLSEAILMAHMLKYLLCSWRHHTGGSGSFDRSCRKRAQSYGLTFGSKGEVSIDPLGQFGEFLKLAQIDLPLNAPSPPRKGKETSKQWSCNCQRVRVGKKDLFAYCPRCRSDFRLGDHIRK